MKHLLQLFIAIAIKESAMNPNALGDSNQALGIAQIHECVVTDVNKRYGKSFKHRDMFDPVIAWNVFIKYQKQYGCKSLEDGARLWNGGPSRRFTDNYWKDVQAITLDRERMADGYKRFGNICRRYSSVEVRSYKDCED